MIPSTNNQPPDYIARSSVVVAESATQSHSIDLRNFALSGIATPAGLEATSLTIETSFDDGTTWLPIRDASGNVLAIVCGASRYITLNPADFAGLRLIRIVLGTVTSAPRTLTLIARKLG